MEFFIKEIEIISLMENLNLLQNDLVLVEPSKTKSKTISIPPQPVLLALALADQQLLDEVAVMPVAGARIRAEDEVAVAAFDAHCPVDCYYYYCCIRLVVAGMLQLVLLCLPERHPRVPYPAAPVLVGRRFRRAPSDHPYLRDRLGRHTRSCRHPDSDLHRTVQHTAVGKALDRPDRHSKASRWALASCWVACVPAVLGNPFAAVGAASLPTVLGA